MTFLEDFINKKRQDSENEFLDALIEKIAIRASLESMHYIFSSFGIDELKAVLKKGEFNRSFGGHSDYTNLVELLMEIQKSRNEPSKSKIDTNEEEEEKVKEVKT